MVEQSPPKPRKLPKQSRSQMLVSAIQEASLKILANEGPDALTTQRIADVAGINIASLYQYFPNKEAILTTIFEQQIENYKVSAQERFREIDQLSRVSLEETLAAIISMEVEQHRVLQKMSPAFYRAYQASFNAHRDINELTVALDNPPWEEWFPGFLQRHAQRLRNQDVATLSSVATHVLTGTLVSIVREEPELLEKSDFQQELLTLLVRYLCK